MSLNKDDRKQLEADVIPWIVKTLRIRAKKGKGKCWINLTGIMPANDAVPVIRRALKKKGLNCVVKRRNVFSSGKVNLRIRGGEVTFRYKPMEQG